MTALPGEPLAQPVPTLIIIAPQPLAQDMLADWLRGVLSPCRIRMVATVEGLAGVAGSSGKMADMVILGDLFDGAMSPSALVTAARRVLMPGGEAVPVVVVSDRSDGTLATECLHLGARGYVPTSLPSLVAAAGLRLVLCGGVFIPPDALGARPAAALDAADPTDAAARLTAPDVTRRLGLSPREAEILCLVHSGRSNRAIAETLHISENTVMVHMRNLMRKLRATNRTQAVFTALRRLSEEGVPTAADMGEVERTAG